MKRPNEQSDVKVEKALMFGAYIVRKLDEAQKIPPAFLERQEKLEFSVGKGTVNDFLNNHRIEDHYDFDDIQTGTKDWMFIINQIIHSYSLVYSRDDFEKLDGFLINSDKTKKKALFYLPLETVLRIFLTISEGDITSFSGYRAPQKGTDGVIKLGEVKLANIIYSYPEGFDIEKSISDTMNGRIYVRLNDE